MGATNTTNATTATKSDDLTTHMTDTARCNAAVKDLGRRDHIIIRERDFNRKKG